MHVGKRVLMERGGENHLHGFIKSYNQTEGFFKEQKTHQRTKTSTNSSRLGIIFMKYFRTW